MPERHAPTETVTRKPDDVVGSRADHRKGDAQTAEQAAITQQGTGGCSDSERRGEWEKSAHAPGRPPPATGGASGGHADQKAASGGDGKVAAGHYKTERAER